MPGTKYHVPRRHSRHSPFQSALLTLHPLPPPITLRQLDASHLQALQDLYAASTSYFTSHSGAPAAPEQAALTYHDVLARGDRALLGVWWEREMLVGCFDLRFDHPAAGIVWFGALIFRDELPQPRRTLAAWSVGILEEWLRTSTEMAEMRLALLLQEREQVRFWASMGFEATGESLRQPIGRKNPRLAIYRKRILHGQSP